MSTETNNHLAPLVAGDLSPGSEARLFWRIRRQMLSSIMHEAFTAARLRLTVLVLLTALFWVALFFLFTEGFQFLKTSITQVSTRTQIVHAVFNTFFFTLTFMIAISSAIVLYGGLYRSHEVGMLLTLPVRPARIVLYKFQEALLVSCWGFVLLGTPLLISYGIVNGAPTLYYVVIVPFMISFVSIPASLGATACILFSSLLPELRRRALWLAVGALGFLLMYVFWEFFSAATQNMLTPAWLHDMLSRLRFTEQRMFPSWWLSSGLLDAAHPPEDDVKRFASESVLLLGVLVSNALMGQLVLTWVGEKLFRPSFSRLQGLMPSHRSTKPIFVDRLLEQLLARFSPFTRSIMVKDVRLFRRDPVLWAQFLIFFGLLGFYVISLRRLEYASTLTRWITVMGFMNVGVITLIYSTFATRFILPLISLEGRAFWVLGTAPISRASVINAKFFLATAASIPPCLALVLISDAMLVLPLQMPILMLSHAVAVCMLCVAISGLAVGNGSRFPNLRENSPSRIAAGFGGTLNLVESCILIMLVVLLIGVPGYCWADAHDSQSAMTVTGLPAWLASTWSVLGSLAIASTICGLSAWLTMRMGLRAFERQEF